MQEAEERLSLEQIRGFLKASDGVRFEAKERQKLYGWMEPTLRQHDSERLGWHSKGLVRRYVAKIVAVLVYRVVG